MNKYVQGIALKRIPPAMYLLFNYSEGVSDLLDLSITVREYSVFLYNVQYLSPSLIMSYFPSNTSLVLYCYRILLPSLTS